MPTVKSANTPSRQGKRKRTSAPSKSDERTTPRQITKAHAPGPIKAACNQCRRRRIRCDGHRPTCSPCMAYRLAKKCDYDTKDLAESRTAALKRQNEKLRDTLASLARAFGHIRSMTEEDALGVLDQLRRAKNPVAAIGSFGRMLSAIPLPASSNTVSAESHMELELIPLQGAAHRAYELVNREGIATSLADPLSEEGSLNRKPP